MSNWLNLDTARFTSFGQVVRTGAQTFAQGGPGTSTLFTIHTGAVLVTMLAGLITTVPGGDPGFTMGFTPSGAGTAEANGLGTTVAVTEEAGTWVTPTYAPTTNKPTALSVGGHAGNLQYVTCAAFLASPGAITLYAANAETGAISWYLCYVPLDEGAYVRELTN